jgi:hypothetical protein
MKIFMISLMFFVIGALFIISNDNLRMNEQENIEKFSESYIEWINQIYLNIQALTGNVIKLDWFPE